MKEIYDKVIAGDVETVKQLVGDFVKSGKSPEDILDNGLIVAMNKVGECMKNGTMYIPEVLIAAEAMKSGLEIIKPLLVGKFVDKGRIMLGTVAGDLHDIGKNLVKMLLEGSGFEVFDLGVDVAPEKFLQVYLQYKPDIIGLSALLTTTMPAMGQTVKLLRDKASSVKIIVGGAPVSAEFADQIGADGYASDAVDAVALCRKILQKST
jgi:5-methyltetrahydrofolate--homocysteine methyltransferase